MNDEWFDPLIDTQDLDGLVRAVDELCTLGEWEQLLTLRDRCRAAVLHGRQVWPIASLAEYRLCLLAPPHLAAGVVMDNTGFPSAGPLTEVIASRCAWADLDEHLVHEPLRSFVAHERIVRGEDLSAVDFDDDVLDLPRQVQPWEPQYLVAAYSHGGLVVDEPTWPNLVGCDVDVRQHSKTLHTETVHTATLHTETPHGRVIDAVREVVRPWTADSNGRCDVVAVDGNALDAIAALGPPRVRVVEITLAEALSHTSWAASGGGAHGRRRGSAQGRFATWWLLTALVGRLDDWPLPPDELHRAAAPLRWWLWDSSEPRTGWQWRLAVQDEVRALAWAWSAIDQT
jgi:hypothetical protein